MQQSFQYLLSCKANETYIIACVCVWGGGGGGGGGGGMKSIYLPLSQICVYILLFSTYFQT